jgi:hypothetical protein
MIGKRYIAASSLVLCSIVPRMFAAGKDPYPPPVAPFHGIARQAQPLCSLVLIEGPSPIERHAALELV